MSSEPRFPTRKVPYRESAIRPTDEGMGARVSCFSSGDRMRKFATELRGKTVMTNDGQILGMIENFIMDTRSGKVLDVLVIPAEEVETRLYPKKSTITKLSEVMKKA